MAASTGSLPIGRNRAGWPLNRERSSGRLEGCRRRVRSRTNERGSGVDLVGDQVPKPGADSTERASRPSREPSSHRSNRPLVAPFRPEFWRSPMRGPWLTSFLGTLLVPAIAVIALTGFIDHWAHYPQFAGNDGVGPSGDIPALFHFPASWPSWSYAVTQGTHVTLGLMVIPFVLAKLWSVMPKLFQRPVVRNVAGALERISLLAWSRAFSWSSPPASS